MMERRDFLTTSALAAGMASFMPSLAGAQTPNYFDGHDLYVLMKFVLDPEDERAKKKNWSPEGKRQLIEDFAAKALVPACKRLGVGPVGVFHVRDGKPSDPVFILIRHQNLESIFTLAWRLNQDADFMLDAESFLNTEINDPAFVRIHSTIFASFNECKRIEVPKTQSPDRIYQLRRYEGHNEVKCWKKVEMFDAGGEIALFRAKGLAPVFFGKALVGENLPNLTYMVTFENEAEQKAAWDRFVKSPEWKEMSGDPQYKDTVSHIENLILQAADCSQI